MKATRLFLAALAVALVSACTSANLTGPSATDAQPDFQTEQESDAEVKQRGLIGSGQG